MRRSRKTSDGLHPRHQARGSLVLLCLLGLTLQSCATLSEDECRSADWREIGYRDGTAGYPRARIEDHEKACRKVGIGADRERYFRARESGLRVYCEPENAVRLGRNGNGYSGVCPPDMALNFERFYQAGRSVYDASRAVDNLDSERRRLEERLAKAGKDEDKRSIRNDLHHLDMRMRHARDNLHDREMRLEREYHYRGGY